MSLSKLPDLVKSQICSFLDFNEIKKLEQINKKIQIFLKRYKLDMPRIKYFRSYRGSSNYRVVLEGCNEVIRLPKIEYPSDQDVHTPQMLKWINKLFSVLSENGTSFFISHMFDLEVNITDVTLDTLSKLCLPAKIELAGLITDITFRRIKKLVEAAVTSGRTDINWNFGTMKKEQFHEVHHFVNEGFKLLIDRMKMTLFFEHENDTADVVARKAFLDSEGYIIRHREKKLYAYRISFLLKKPEELIQRGE